MQVHFQSMQVAASRTGKPGSHHVAGEKRQTTAEPIDALCTLLRDLAFGLKGKPNAKQQSQLESCFVLLPQVGALAQQGNPMAQTALREYQPQIDECLGRYLLVRDLPLQKIRSALSLIRHYGGPNVIIPVTKLGERNLKTVRSNQKKKIDSAAYSMPIVWAVEETLKRLRDRGIRGTAAAHQQFNAEVQKVESTPCPRHQSTLMMVQGDGRRPIPSMLRQDW